MLVNGVVFGESKKAKSSTMLAAFPNAIYVGDVAKTLLTADVELGFEPLVWPCDIGYDIPERLDRQVTDIDMLIEVMDFLGECLDSDLRDGHEPLFDAMCVDDWRLLADGSLTSWEDEGRHINANGNEDPRTLYRLLNGANARVAFRVRDRISMHFWCTTHEIGPDTVNGKPEKGVPDFGSRGQGKMVPKWLYTIVRAITDKGYPDPFDFQYAAFCDPLSSWVTNDSMGIFRKTSPLNIRVAVLLGMDIVLSRRPGLEWQDAVMHWVAGQLSELDKITTERVWDIAQKAGARAAERGLVDPAAPGAEKHMRWAVQDGLALAIFQQQKRRSIFK